MEIETTSEQLFFTTARIDTLTGNKTAGSGTAFVVSYPVNDQEAHFLVTNKHVVNEKDQGWITFHTSKDQRVDLGNGLRIEILDWKDAWFGHPDPTIDVAIVPLIPIIEHAQAKLSKGIFYKSIPHSIFIDAKQEKELDALEEIAFIGYPNGIWDKTNQLPVVRRGMTASPIQLDFDGEPKFVIDASVFGGSSGSPVFLHSKGMYSNRSGDTIIGSRTIFLGVVTAVFYRTEMNKVISVPIPTADVAVSQHSEMLDLGLVTKARGVTEAIKAFLSDRGLLE